MKHDGSMTSRRLRGVRTLAALAASALLLAGCGDESEPADDPTPTVSDSDSATPTPSADTTTAEPAGTSVDVTINGDDVSPMGKPVAV